MATPSHVYTAPSHVYTEIAARYGVDTADEVAVERFFQEGLPEKDRQAVFDELLARNDESTLSWDHTYLLGWYDHGGQAFLTTWDGKEPDVYAVVTGCSPMTMPLWDAYVPERARLRAIPPGEDGRDYARATGGFYAFGWSTPEPIKRRKNPFTGLRPAR